MIRSIGILCLYRPISKACLLYTSLVGISLRRDCFKGLARNVAINPLVCVNQDLQSVFYRVGQGLLLFGRQLVKYRGLLLLLGLPLLLQLGKMPLNLGNELDVYKRQVSMRLVYHLANTHVFLYPALDQNIK